MTANNKPMIGNTAGLNQAWVIKATISNTSPLVMGIGEGDVVDKAIAKRKNGQVYIPGSAFLGCVKRYCADQYGCQLEDENSKEYFWGSDNSKNNNTSQSHLRILPINVIDVKDEKTPDIRVLDGIKIAIDKGVVSDGAKYDYEAINNQVSFGLTMEVYAREGMSSMDIQTYISQIKSCLFCGELSIGAYTGLGFGRIKASKVEIQEFIFPTHALAWFQYKTGKEIVNNFQEIEVNKKESDDVIIQATFALKSAIMTGMSDTTSQSDKSHYTFDNKAALLGKAIKGAVNHRLTKILKTCTNVTDIERLQLLGYGKDEKKQYPNIDKSETTDAARTRLEVDCAIIDKAELSLQDRIAIDRFTGGTIDSAKFDSEPAWAHDGTNLILKFKIKSFNPREVAALLHVIKDLWTSDMPIGGEKNVGRGILIGKSLEIKEKNGICTISQDDSKLKIDDKSNLLKGYEADFKTKLKTKSHDTTK
jgi:hypothetical protein